MNMTSYFGGLMAIFLFSFIWFVLYKHFFTIALRERLFDLRDRLFSYAENNNIPFDNPAFLDRWNEINGMIRFAHEIHIMFFTMLLSKKEYEEGEKNYNKLREEHLAELEQNHQIFFNDNLREQMDLFFSYLVKSSAVLFIISSIVIAIGSVFFYIFTITEKRKEVRLKIRKGQESFYGGYAYLTTESESDLLYA